MHGTMSRPDALWARVLAEGEAKKQAWIEALRAAGVKAAHPDDGWVDRVRNSVFFSYPQFNDGAGPGDLIALGQPNSHRIVRIVGPQDGPLLTRWLFEPTDGDKP